MRTVRSRSRVRSTTSPASWPQAASISSPRVRRTVVTMPARSSTSENCRMVRSDERFSPELGNGLNGIRLNLQGTSATSDTSSCACFTVSLMPLSITYSKVMKSRGATFR